MADQATRSAARLALLVALPVALLAGLLAFWRLGGFASGTGHAGAAGAPDATGAVPSGPVPMPARSLSDREAQMCLAFIAHLPASVRGLAQRQVSAGPEQNAAYGQPPITVACGTTPPPVQQTTYLWNLSGVCWYADESRPQVTTWTTLDRQAPVTVTVPGSYQGAGDWVQEFTATIISEVPSLAPVPAYCPPPSTAPS